MNRNKELIEKRRRLIGIYMENQKRKPGYSFQEATNRAASVFSVSHKTVCTDLAVFNGTIMATTHLQLELSL
ncbi:hypothetical protein [Christiangramia forsetii]|uniref:Uncharacterized protein n=1 Tax=Christiangramia forsetii (strain DSM 17595 / CGMCC 1.15422 / KT0803) TaxID=411154 RepID=A0M450_CHRFK|nr:hypothetical protein [Christiangramia forsetii]CAL67395.1 hypothetical protein GFO_2439 [Christiangramia forsetii KT0803]